MNKTIFQQLQELLPKAYCVYSKFHVAAILETNIGNYEGVNVENAAFPSSICAERSALVSSIPHGMNEIKVVHLLTDDKEGKGNMCGQCRQMLSEFATDQTLVHVYAHNGNRTTFKFFDLLPQSFSKKYL